MKGKIMKKTLLFLTITALMTAGCSKTWSGIKQDTHEVVVDTKEVIHEATAPEMLANESTSDVTPLPVVTSPAETVEVITPIEK